MPTIDQISADPDFQALSPHDQRVVVGRVFDKDPDFAQLSAQDQAVVRNRAFARFPDKPATPQTAPVQPLTQPQAITARAGGDLQAYASLGTAPGLTAYVNGATGVIGADATGVNTAIGIEKGQHQAYQQKMLAREQLLAPKDAATESAISQYNQTFLQEGSKSTPRLILGRALALPLERAEEALPPGLSPIGRLAILRAVREQNGTGLQGGLALPYAASHLTDAQGNEVPITLADAKTFGINKAIAQTKQAEEAREAKQHEVDIINANLTGNRAFVNPKDKTARQQFEAVETRRRAYNVAHQPASPAAALVDALMGAGTAQQVGQMKGLPAGAAQALMEMTRPENVALMAAMGPLGDTAGVGAKLAADTLFGAGAAQGIYQRAKAGDVGGAIGEGLVFGAPFALHGASEMRGVGKDLGKAIDSTPLPEQGLRQLNDNASYKPIFRVKGGTRPDVAPSEPTLQPAQVKSESVSAQRAQLMSQSAQESAQSTQVNPDLEQHLTTAEQAARERLAARKQAKTAPQPEPKQAVEPVAVPPVHENPATASNGERDSPTRSKFTPEQQAYIDKAQVQEGWLPTDQIGMNERAFQFRQRTVADFPNWNAKEAAKNPISVWVDKDAELGEAGKTYVVNGHHRLVNAQKFDVPMMRVRYIDADNAATAREIGAIENLLDSPRNDAIDVAHFLRNTKLPQGDAGQFLRDHGVNTQARVMRDAIGLSKLPEEVFDTVYRHSEATPGLKAMAAAVGENFPDPKDATAQFKDLWQKMQAGQRVTPEFVAERARVLQAQQAAQSQGGMDFDFGDVDTRARVVGEIKDHFGKLIRSGKGLSRRVAESFYQITGEQKDKAQLATQIGEIIDRTAHGVSPLGARVTEAVRAIGQGADEGATTQQLIRELETGGILHDTLTEGRADQSGAGSGAHEGVQQAPVEQEKGPDLFGETANEASAKPSAREKLDSLEEAAKDRIAARKGKGKSSLGTFGGSAVSDLGEDLQDYAIIGAAKIARIVDRGRSESADGPSASRHSGLTAGALTLADFSKSMLAEFPDLAAHIQDVYKAALDHYHTQIAPKFGLPTIANSVDKGLSTESNSPDKGLPEQSSSSGKNPPASSQPFQSADRQTGHTGFQTGTKNETTEAERAQRGASPTERQAYTTMGAAYEQGRQAVESGSTDPRALAAAVANEPRPLTASEVGALGYDRARIINEHNQVTKDLASAIQAGDDAKIADLKAKQQILEDAYDKNDAALVKGGREQSAAFNARKLLINDDYSLAPVLQRATAAKGETLTPQERTRYEALTAQLAEKEKQLADRDERISQLEADRNARQMQRSYRQQKRAMTKAEIDAELEGLLKEFSQNTGRTLNAGVDPELVKIIGKIAYNRVKAGVVNAEGLVDQVYNLLQDKAQGLTRRDVRDAISGYGQETQPRKPDAVRRQLNDLKTQMRLISAILDAKEGIQPEPATTKAAQNPQTEMLRAQLQMEREAKFGKAQRKPSLDSLKTATMNRIMELQRRIASQDFARPTRGAGPTDPELEALHARLGELREAYEAMKPKATRDALPGIKTKLQNEIADLQERLRTNNFDFPKRTPTVYDAEATQLKAQRDALKLKIEQAVKGVQKPTWHDYLARWQRFSVLSGVSTLGKLGSAAAGRAVTTPLEELIGAPLARTKLGAAAPREGGFNPAAERAALAQFFSKATFGDMLQKLKTGANSLDVQFGRHDAEQSTHHPILDFFGSLHGAIKTPAQRAEFFRAFEKRSAIAQRKGLDLQDPAVQMSIGAESYADSKRAILMGDNVAVKIYQDALSSLERKGHKTTATVARMAMPIVKVPTNYVAEASNYIVGAPIGLAKIIAARGVDNLTPEQADSVLRAFKKQGLGAGLLALGYLNSQQVQAGGYYARGQKPQRGKPGFGDLSIFGITIPHALAHTPAMEAIQFGATMRRAMDATKGDLATKAGEAAHQAGMGLVKETPFAEQISRFGNAMDSSAGAGKFGGEFVKGVAVPQIVQQAAKATDKAPARYPRGFRESVMTGIPGAREQVPANKPVRASRQADGTSGPNAGLRRGPAPVYDGGGGNRKVTSDPLQKLERELNR